MVEKESESNDMKELSERRLKLREEDIQDFEFVLPEDLKEESEERKNELLALVDFVTDLYKTPGVNAVAFLALQEAPMVLAKEVFTPLRRNDQVSAQIVKSVTEAHGRLTRRERTLGGGLSFVNTVRFSVESLMERVQERWGREGKELLAFIEFDRNS